MSNPNRVTRLLSEGVVIVASILLAFWIDAWWEGKQARSFEAAMIESINAEAVENRARLDGMLEINRRDLERIDLFLASTLDELKTVPGDSIPRWLNSLVIAWTYDGDLSAAGLILDSSVPVTARGLRVRDLAAAWVAVLEDAEEEKATLWAVGTQLTDRLAAFATPVAGEGQGFLTGVAARRGAEVLAELRQDEAFVAAVLNKAHYQNIYVLELDQASVVLDSLEVVAR